jgi:D-lyxose ketol-isomerase
MNMHRQVDKLIEQKRQRGEDEAVPVPKRQEPEGGKLQKMLSKHEKKWKQKFIKIWQYNEQLENQTLESKEIQVGPKNFMPIMKLGQGSFGQVFLCEKFTIRPDGFSTIPTGKLYAMKILNKK